MQIIGISDRLRRRKQSLHIIMVNSSTRLVHNDDYSLRYLFNSTPSSNMSTPTRKHNYIDIPHNVLHAIYILNGAMACLGILGNAFSCIIIVKGRKMYTIANIFLMNLAIADLFILLISYPLWIIMNILPTAWPFGSALCKIIPPVSDAFYGVSLGCMVAISIHRYRMIIHAMEMQMKFIHAKLIIIFFYFISLLTISVPIYRVMLYEERLVRRDTIVSNITKSEVIVEKICRWEWPSWCYERYYMIFLTTVWYLIPLLIILFTFLRIKCFLQKQMTYEWINNVNSNISVKGQVIGIKKALRMLAPVVIVFALLMLPWNILRVISIFMRLKELDYIRIYLLIASTMLVANSAVNPFIYYIASKEFRAEFKKHFIWMTPYCKRRYCDENGVNNRSVKLDRKLTFNSDTINEDIRQNKKDPEYTDLKNHGFVNGTKDLPNFDELFQAYARKDYYASTLNGAEICLTLGEEQFMSRESCGSDDVFYGVNQSSQLYPKVDYPPLSGKISKVLNTFEEESYRNGDKDRGTMIVYDINRNSFWCNYELNKALLEHEFWKTELRETVL